MSNTGISPEPLSSFLSGSNILKTSTPQVKLLHQT